LFQDNERNRQQKQQQDLGNYCFLLLATTNLRGFYLLIALITILDKYHLSDRYTNRLRSSQSFKLKERKKEIKMPRLFIITRNKN
jgi:hypothetical protein